MPDRTTRLLACLLVLSGALHLALWACTDQAWEGAVSLRKPALFGISGGMTLWSLGWVFASLPPKRSDTYWLPIMAWALVCEIGLITWQYWRGVPSHFNHATALDSVIEGAMLVLILLVTGIIGWLCLRVLGPLRQTPAMALAMRGGLLLLFLSCLLGLGVTGLGQWNLMHGRPYQTWGQAGVLKFPHGIALHAIQLLPICAWLLQRWKMPQPEWAIRGLFASQCIAMLFAIWQTANGRARFDLDTIGTILLVAAIVSAVAPLGWSLAKRRRSMAVG